MDAISKLLHALLEVFKFQAQYYTPSVYTFVAPEVFQC